MQVNRLKRFDRGLIMQGARRLTAGLLILVLPSFGINVASAQTVTGAKYPQDDNAGTRICSALGLSDARPDTVIFRTTDVLGRVNSVRVKADASWPITTPPCTPLKGLALAAAETILRANEKTRNYSFDDALKAIQTDAAIRNQVVGALAVLITGHIVKNEPNPQLRQWATDVYRKNIILAAKGSLDEYLKWKKDPCGYQAEGYVKPQACAKSIANFYDTSIRPPSDLIGKAGLRVALGDEATIANAVATGASAVLYTISNVAILSTLGFSNTFTGGTIMTSLYLAFGGYSAGATTAAGYTVGSLGATGWTGVAAGPVAAIVFALTIGITKGLEIFENAAVEPNLKRALGAAMSQEIAIRNVLKEESGASLFIAGVISAAQDPGWQVLLPKLDGDGELQVRHIWTGTDAEAMRVLRDQLPADVLKKSFQEAMIKRFPSATLNGDPQYVDDQTNNVMTVTTNFIVPGMATERSGNYLVPFSASNFKGTLAPMGSQARTAPVVIPGHPFNGTYTFKVALPDSIDIWETPFDSRVEGKHFAASNELKYRGNVVTATLSLETRADRIEIVDMKTYNDDMQKLVKTALGAVL